MLTLRTSASSTAIERWGFRAFSAVRGPSYLAQVTAEPQGLPVPPSSETYQSVVILPEHPDGLLPDLRWSIAPACGHAYARIQQRGVLLAEASIDGPAQRITVWAHPDVQAGDAQQFFASAVVPLAARIAGSLVLHASTLLWNERLLAFTAASGGGKSTTVLLALAVLPDAALFADDAVAVRLDGAGLCVTPGPQRLKADPTTAALAHRHGFAAHVPVFSMGDKVFVDVPPADPSPRSQLDDVFVLERAAPGNPGAIDPLVGAHAAAVLHASRSTAFYATPALLRSDIRTIARMLEQHETRVWRLRVPHGIDAAAAWIASTFRPWLQAQQDLVPEATPATP